ncbi:unnamed protein product [Bursaphelenchus xylophilus]|uniref:(pine wood nematode) hypothetical protein n=1 Tax=Bursaphelenchus xylophilus TaxID=6326 RepID=A0A1I7SSB1_BURXY|nr:unnamed protein product [Bursaphelenchus xylophilus]CAG9097788.1 unnamed protein product [Bursaphelenchus xylophilus]
MDLYSRSTMFPMMHYASNDSEQILQQHLHSQSQLGHQKDRGPASDQSQEYVSAAYVAANFSNFPLVAAAASQLNGSTGNNNSGTQNTSGSSLGGMEEYQMNQLHHNSAQNRCDMDRKKQRMRLISPTVADKSAENEAKDCAKTVKEASGTALEIGPSGDSEVSKADHQETDLMMPWLHPEASELFIPNLVTRLRFYGYALGSQLIP